MFFRQINQVSLSQLCRSYSCQAPHTDRYCLRLACKWMISACIIRHQLEPMMPQWGTKGIGILNKIPVTLKVWFQSMSLVYTRMGDWYISVAFNPELLFYCRLFPANLLSNKCWIIIIVNWTLTDRLQWNHNQYNHFFLTYFKMSSVRRRIFGSHLYKQNKGHG